jgi:phospholipase C
MSVVDGGSHQAGRAAPATTSSVSRRAFLGAGAAVAAAGVLGPTLLGRALAKGATSLGADAVAVDPASVQSDALRALGRNGLRWPDSLPFPALPAGTDTMPQIEHVVVLCQENHSFDNVLGMLGRGDGFTLGADGRPTATNPYPDGRIQHAFHMPTTCQLSSQPSQEWEASHTAYDGGRMDGFVGAPIFGGSTELVGGVAMGYWTAADLPFTYSLASHFPIADRWFCSVLGQTDPNRRYLIAGTSSGMTDDISLTPGPGQVAQDLLLLAPANGTIFDRLSAHGITWADYNASFPTGTTAELYPLNDAQVLIGSTNRPFAQFFSDAAAGTLPAFSFLDPDYGTQSQENPQNIVVGEAMLSQVVQALGSGPDWKNTLLVLTYDEHGGYFDHVPPPVALAPDAIPPVVPPGESTYDGFWRYGFRVPGLIVSPYAKRNHVSHVLYDHTSVLALVERKWNLPAMTWRDANANDLTDLLAMDALAAGRPVFRQLPPLAPPGDTPAALACSKNGPGTVPPPGSISSG